jgi:hypothetical protein
MRVENVSKTLVRDLDQLFDRIRGDLERVEMLTMALQAFSDPIPDYEPRFHHIAHSPLKGHELR